MFKKIFFGIVMSLLIAGNANAATSLGTFKLTFYCPCRKCSGSYGHQTATGARCKEGVTVAVDPKVIPFGTHIIINGHEYIAQDDGGDWVKGNHIDIFMESHEECEEAGVQKAEVFLAN